MRERSDCVCARTLLLASSVSSLATRFTTWCFMRTSNFRIVS